MNRQELERTLVDDYGWQLEAHGSDALDRSLKQRMAWLNLGQENEYLALLARDSEELVALLEELIVPESWFFREREAIAEATDLAMQKLSRHPGQPIRVLSAPCSRGEEPLSLAVSLLEAGLPDELLQIDAVDLSAQSLAHAKKGIYTAFSFRGNDLSFRDRAFEAVTVNIPIDKDKSHGKRGIQLSQDADGTRGVQGWRIAPRFQSRVTFHRVNLLEPNEHLQKYDVIFCRNLLIYLTESARLKLFHTLSRALNPDGAMFLAACEFALPPSHLLRYSKGVNAYLFQKVPQTYVADLRQATPKSKPPILPSLHPRPPIARPSQATRLPPRSPHPPVRTTASSAPSPAVGKAALGPNLLELAENAANQGRLQEAQKLCERELKTQPSAKAYYLLAVVFSAQNLSEETETNLRKALYLEPANADALAQLALCREKAGDIQGARRLRERIKRD